jgi:transcription elongation factor/antiterminator RfaH
MPNLTPVQSAATAAEVIVSTALAPQAGIPTWHTEAVRRWYALQTRSRHEKVVHSQLEQKAFESFLPLYRSVRRWKDRRKELALPLFPGYVFVRMELSERREALKTHGVARIVSFGGIPASLPEKEIEAIRHFLEKRMRVDPHPYLRVGQRARIRSGPFAGLEGILLRKKNRLRFVISLDLIYRSVAVEIDAEDLMQV